MSKDQFWTRIIYIVSIVISLAVAFLILGPRPEGIEGALDVSGLPLVNATINGITTILLIVGYLFIIRKEMTMHRNIMLTSFGTSSLFLVTYIIYHWFKSGPKLYTGDFGTIYYFILITHILLAMIIIPLALFTLYRGWFSQLKRHRKIASKRGR